ncbi:MAG: undecaprenyldiphospho-muramoylpentapeptide beta-N-acetylglucosaminyltransferase [Oscillospiraceae bacterium]|nr:undecaprenyldiphospho-muramoylpentapeptide beta-N-acetylglucosaminyltransferase [Oscillospiraceae bacterium]
MLKVILAGGGTAGHVNPALAIMEIIKEHRPDAEFLYVGTPNGIEKDLVAKAGLDFAPMDVAGFQRKISFENLKRNLTALKYLAASGKRAKKIINDFKPDIVIGTGGYVSGPIVRQAAKMGVKTAIHEQNAFPGVTTKLLSKSVDKVMLTVEKAKDYIDAKEKCVVTGLPVRSGFSTKKLSKEEARKQLGLDDSICILSTGGSLGAGKINETVADLIAWYEENGVKVNHIHSYGKNGRATFVPDLLSKGVKLADHPNYIVKEYIDNMPVCMAAADLIISRCGAGALTEIQAVGCGSVLVPSPIVAENHQYHNGKVLCDAGAAVMFEQKDLTGEILIKTVSELIADPDKLNELSENAKNLYIKDTPDRVYEVISSLV